MKKYAHIDDEKLIERLAPKIEERIKFHIMRGIINALEGEFYPPEDMIRADFIKSVEEAEEEIKKGKSKVYTYEEFEKEFAE